MGGTLSVDITLDELKFQIHKRTDEPPYLQKLKFLQIHGIPIPDADEGYILPGNDDLTLKQILSNLRENMQRKVNLGTYMPQEFTEIMKENNWSKISKIEL